MSDHSIDRHSGRNDDRIQELTWALLDEQVTDADLAELEALLLPHKTARDAYVRCVQMHVDLMLHYQPSAAPRFTPPATTQPATKTQVLGLLAEGLPQIGTPTVGDVAT